VTVAKEHLMTRLMGWICALWRIAMSAAVEPVNYQGLWSAAAAGSKSVWTLVASYPFRTVLIYDNVPSLPQ
jgi:hypothetical protein